MSLPLRVATRGSELALLQADHARRLLAAQGIATELVIVKTTGDVEPARPLYDLEETGFFTKQIEAALVDGRADVAVHSLKDLPTTLPDGLLLGAVLERGDPRDCLVARLPGVRALADLPPGARVGTSSPRRAAQLKGLRRDLEVKPIRGNVPTRLEQVRAGADFDAAVLALAGLDRLGLLDRVAARFDLWELMPAPGQGALALEVRSDDTGTARRVLRLSHHPSWVAVTAERALLAALEGGCRAPIAAYAEPVPDGFKLWGRVIAIDGSGFVEAAVPVDDRRPKAAGAELAELLRARGADEITRAARRDS